MDNNNDINNINDINDNNPYIIAFKQIIHCLPINNYVLNIMTGIITYYCGQNNTFIIPIDSINNLINNK